VKVWTDGCVLKNPGGAGGWAWVLEKDGEEIDRACGGSDATTNNIMEMTAVIAGLQAVTGPVEIISDSQYVIHGITLWIHRWKRNGWRRKGRGGKALPIANQELWVQLDALVRPNVVFSWVKGHNNAHFNELADQLAGEEARRIRDGLAGSS
jgi:ribonuclease HI